MPLRRAYELKFCRSSEQPVALTADHRLPLSFNQRPAKLRDSIRFRIELPIRDSIRSDDPIRNFRIVRTVDRPL